MFSKSLYDIELDSAVVHMNVLYHTSTPLLSISREMLFLSPNFCKHVLLTAVSFHSLFLVNLVSSSISVAALPCKIWVFNCTTLRQSYSVQKCAVCKSFISRNIYWRCHVLDHVAVQIADFFTILQRVFKVSAISTHACFWVVPVSRGQWRRRWGAVFERSSRRCRKIPHWYEYKSQNRQRHSEKNNKLKLTLSNKNIC